MHVVKMTGRANGFKYLVLCSGIFINTFVFGMTFAFGSLFNGLSDTFNENVSMTSAVQSILIGVSQTAGIFSGMLFSRYQMWNVFLIGAILCPLGFIMAFFVRTIVLLYVSISFMSGFGVSILFIGSTVAVGRVFSGPQRLLALSVQNAGIGVGAAGIPYILDFLLDIYGINGTFLIMGGFYLHCLPIVRLYKFVDHDNSIHTTDNPNEHKRASLYSVIKAEVKGFLKTVQRVIKLPYVLSTLGVAAIMASFNGFFSLIVDILTWKGFTHNQVLIAYPVTQGIGLLGRLVPGIVKQINGINSLVFPIIFGLLGFSGQCVINNTSQFPMVLVGCCLAGIAMSGVTSSANIIVVQIVEDENISIGIGMLYSAVGLLSAVAGPSYGAVKDNTDSYTTVLYLTAGFQMLGSILFILTILARRFQHRISLHSGEGFYNYAIEVTEVPK